MFFTSANDNIKIFLSDTSQDAFALRENLRLVLEKAGIDVVTLKYDKQKHKSNIGGYLNDAIHSTNCSIHILGNKYDQILNIDPKQSITEFEFQKAREHNAADSMNYKMFIWQPESYLLKESDPSQEKFVNSVRNSIFRNMIFSTVGSTVMFVEDIRSIMQTEQSSLYDVKDTEIFMIYNELDEEEAVGIIDLLGDVAKIEKLGIDISSRTDYAQLVSQQLVKSKLGVIYFKRTASWALPFTQQVWKNTGGASAKTPILLIGDGNHDVNQGKVFNAPKIISQVIPEELIPLEIKVQFDNIIGK